MDRKVLFEVKDLKKEYRMGEIIIKALDGVSFKVYEGEYVVILGPSGSGKSTLMNIMGGMDVLTSGRVFFEGEDISHLDEKKLTYYRKEKIGFVFQFYNLIASLTALENVAIAAELSENAMDTEKTLEMVGLAERKDNFPSQLSGGEQQRVAIARGIVKNPDVLLCDEPTGALDSTTGRRILRVLQDINREWNKTVVIITHNSGIAATADRVIRMGDGMVVEEYVNEKPIPPEEVEW